MDETAPEVPLELPPQPPPRPIARPVAKRAPARQKRAEREEIYDDEPKKSNTMLLLIIGGFAAFLLFSLMIGLGWYFWAESKPQSQQQPTFSYVGTSTKPVGNTGYNSATAYRPPPIAYKPPRPFYMATMAKPLTFTDGVAEVTGKLEDTDPQMSFRPIKAYSLSLDANRMYFLEVRSSNGVAFGPELKLLASNNTLVASGRTNPERTACRLTFAPHTSQLMTLQLWLTENQPCNFTFTIREATSESEWPEGFEKVIVQDRLPSRANRQIHTHYAGAFSAAEQGLYWLASDTGDLEKYRCESQRYEGFCKLQWKVSHLAACGNGSVYATVKVGVPAAGRSSKTVTPTKEELQIFSAADLEKVRPGTALKPTDTLGIEGTATAMCLNTTTNSLYILDGKINAVVKIDTEKKEVAEQNGLIMAGAKAMVLSKDGKSLYLCGIGNKVQKLDATTLKVEKSINFMDASEGEYDGIQVRERGMIYLAGKNKERPRRWVAMLDPSIEGTPKLMPFENLRGATAICLNSDQRRLFISHSPAGSPGILEEHYISPIPMMLEGQIAATHSFTNTVGQSNRLTLSPDGRWLIGERGLVLMLAP